MNGKRIGYARVSTDRQTTDQQVEALRQAGCDTVFVDDGVRSTAPHRPGLEQAKQALNAHDVFVVWAIDRAFRSTIDAILFLDDLMQQDIAFQSLTQHIDTRTPEGRKWFIDTASWAEYERAIISRRTKEKMAYAKSQGQHIGRPVKLSMCRAQCAYRMIKMKGKSWSDVASLCRVSPSTLSRTFKRYGLDVSS